MLPLPCLIFPIETKDFLKKGIPSSLQNPPTPAMVLGGKVANHFLRLKPKDTFQPFIFWSSSSHWVLLTTYILPETSPLMLLTLLSSLHSHCSICFLPIFWGASSSKVCVLEAGVFQSVALGSLPFFTHPPGPFPPYQPSHSHLLLSLQGQKQLLCHWMCMIRLTEHTGHQKQTIFNSHLPNMTKSFSAIIAKQSVAIVIFLSGFSF